MDDWDDDEANTDDIAQLIELVEVQRDAVKAIGTGTQINTKLEGEYRRRSKKIGPALKRLGIKDPFQWPDLHNAWGWLSKWGKYQERRMAIDERVGPVLERLEALHEGSAVEDWGGTPDSWSAVETRLRDLRQRMDGAATLDDFQDVGRRGREVIIDVVNLMWEHDMVPDGAEAPKGSDAKGKFDRIVDAYVPGRAHAELRRLVKSAWDLANQVTHAGGITRVDAYAAAQSTVLIVRTLGEMHEAGRPDAS